MTTTTRLHISGLTPAITQNDIKTRFSTFGEVKDVDGVGKLDGLGQPRKFAYLTLESTKDKLARCMNLLSGSTWKGAKLRVGQARPDFRARRELELNPPPRPKLDPLALRRARIKRRLRARRLMRGAQGKEAKDMSLVTLENVHTRKGWRRTPLDHLIRPLRMRPLRPISLPPRSATTSKAKTKLKTSKIKRRKFGLTRSRCTVIDPARYGAVHLKIGTGGIDEGLLGGGEIEVGQNPVVGGGADEAEVASTISSSSEPKPASSSIPVHQCPSPPIPASSSPLPDLPPAITPTTKPSSSVPIESQYRISLAQEKASTLALLSGLFSGDDWGGSESISGDEIDVRDGTTEEVGYEVVPRAQADPEVGRLEENGDMEVDKEQGGESEYEAAENEEESQEASEDKTPAEPENRQYTALKDMFKPQEETAGFSFGLDIELDPDAESFLPASVQTQPVPEPSIATISVQAKHKHAIQYTPDAREIMFFPGTGKKDVFDIIQAKGWKWEHPGTSEEIRAKWDESKLDLTREYNRRHREAVKKQRRGGVSRREEP
ncbi:RNA recognition motif protein [Ceratobasidium sp. AG-Ba]|nr:RNA recognition motif protein [Ceratobasidium sp. AG-Ba]